MRGKLIDRLYQIRQPRITPADAGKTSGAVTIARKIYGSPPRMRGKLEPAAPVGIPIGITPADAGKTTCFFLCGFFQEDHPRGCGENSTIASANRIVEGSPPRMRGKQARKQKQRKTSGITPADAGKTLRTSQRRLRTRDHPRGCGENDLSPNISGGRFGSPPRMRGKLRYNLAKVIQIRITPADAGKTIAIDMLTLADEDHPRGCGENRMSRECRLSALGSPPRMRGKLGLCMHERFEKRITPADAGKTPPTPKPARLRKDHPRGCGENDCFAISSTDVSGSPPRMRGKQSIFLHCSALLRITPADAGKTSNKLP